MRRPELPIHLFLGPRSSFLFILDDRLSASTSVAASIHCPFNPRAEGIDPASTAVEGPFLSVPPNSQASATAPASTAVEIHLPESAVAATTRTKANQRTNNANPANARATSSADAGNLLSVTSANEFTRSSERCLWSSHSTLGRLAILKRVKETRKSGKSILPMSK